MPVIYGSPEIKTPVKVLFDIIRVTVAPGVRTNPLSPDQEEAKNRIMGRLRAETDKKGRTILVLAGAAGTGKTTLMRSIIDELNKDKIQTFLAAPTGKAAARLRETTGLKTGTVHKLIYAAPTTVGICPSCGKSSPALGMPEKSMRKTGATQYTCPECAKTFPLNYQFETKLGFAASEDESEKKPQKAVVIIDEASMVDEKMAADLNDLLSPLWSILYVGDREQLPPVQGKWGADFSHPTAVLDKVHRQAEGSPIIDLATRLRTGRNAANPLARSPALANHPALQVYRADATAPAQWLAKMRQDRQDATLLCLSNKMRHKLNELVRRYRGLEKKGLEAGLPLVQADRACVMTNNHTMALMNGEVFIVNNTVKASKTLCNELGEDLIWVQFWPNPEFYLCPVRALIDPNFPGVQEFKAIFEDPVAQYRKIERYWDMLGKGDDLYFADQELLDAAEEYVPQIQGMTETYLKMREKRPDTMKGHPPEMGQIKLLEEMFSDIGAIPSQFVLYLNYGECLTTHKSQGSQWNNVGVVLEGAFWAQWKNEKDHDAARRWLYTAVTRASQTLRIWGG